MPAFYLKDPNPWGKPHDGEHDWYLCDKESYVSGCGVTNEYCYRYAFAIALCNDEKWVPIKEDPHYGSV